MDGGNPYDFLDFHIVNGRISDDQENSHHPKRRCSCRRYRGSPGRIGHGLSIARELIRGHRGGVSLESTGEEGRVSVLNFPVEKKHEHTRFAREA
ncbi:MAG: HAMP domain-containing histidine kinase [Rhodospirillaceae bacterium]|nr:MAG: HAMP domain-containing histidine kinase [Rhodospirillaceae bacterium]